MKNVVLGLCSLFLIAGCSADKEDKYSVYEWHSYDAQFKHKEEFIVKYDDMGKLKYLETITAWYKEKYSSCDCANQQMPKYPDLKYKDIGYNCEELKSGGIKISYYMTDNFKKTDILVKRMVIMILI